MLKFMKNIEEYFLVTGMAAMSFLVFIQVVARYVFHYAMPWTEEVSRFLFLWMVWIGAAYATKKNAHLKITALVDHLPKFPRLVCSVIVFIVWIVFAVMITIKGIQLSKMLFLSEQTSPVMEIPMGYMYLSVPVGTGLMSLRLIQNLFLKGDK